MRSLFGVHVWQAMYRAYPDNIPSPPPGRVWSFEDFRNVGLTSIESVRGGIVTAGLILLLGVTLVFASYFLEGLEYLRSTTVVYVLIVLFLLGLIGSIEPTRRAVGRAMDLYLKAADRLLGGRRH
jgi:hypothetical protein